ncbi:hypothetical protein J2X69_004924 [Algoriphagus sp. 4150]|nr:hypothetical protein [Algoriphagus sp. 4150]
MQIPGNCDKRFRKQDLWFSVYEWSVFEKYMTKTIRHCEKEARRRSNLFPWYKKRRLLRHTSSSRYIGNAFFILCLIFVMY